MQPLDACVVAGGVGKQVCADMRVGATTLDGSIEIAPRECRATRVAVVAAGCVVGAAGCVVGAAGCVPPNNDTGWSSAEGIAGAVGTPTAGAVTATGAKSGAFAATLSTGASADPDPAPPRPDISSSAVAPATGGMAMTLIGSARPSQYRWHSVTVTASFPISLNVAFDG